jgi:mRNA-degrading endonuclease RelE of RelBE toxin-antitoxin system
MIEIIATDEFKKLYLALPVAIRKKAQKQEKIFCQNPFHPSLHIEKLEPKGRQLWSIRVDRAYRIVFRFLDSQKVIFLVVGHHHWIYKKV